LKGKTWLIAISNQCKTLDYARIHEIPHYTHRKHKRHSFWHNRVLSTNTGLPHKVNKIDQLQD
jgi:hypothetical protein